MRNVKREAKMRKSLEFFSIALVVVLMLCVASVAKANLITNGDFATGTLAGWDASGDVIATNYSNMPVADKNNWDLSAWDSRMDGYFALYRHSGFLDLRIALGPDVAPTFLSLDYAVAWSDPIDCTSIGYFYADIRGIDADDNWWPLAYKEKQWAGFDFGLDKNVFTGSIYTELILHPVIYNEISVNLYAFNPHSLNQIVGIDNVNLSVVPIPEPCTILLVGFGLAGLAGFGRKLKRD
jgi:hypothetical protein